MTYGLGRKIEFDERSRAYNIADLLPVRAATFSKLWPCTTVLDQGDAPACVGFSWASEVNGEPVTPLSPLQAGDALQIYYAAQRVDEWPGENYDGTSVLAGAKVMNAQGYLSEYRWAFNLDDALSTLSNIGPFVLGTNWYSNMFFPDEFGFLDIGGDLAGGHAILVNEVDVERQCVRLHNTWGASWGLGGEAFLTFDNLGRLLADSGEACVPLVRTLPGDQPPAPPAPGGCLGKFFGKFARKG